MAQWQSTCLASVRLWVQLTVLQRKKRKKKKTGNGKVGGGSIVVTKLSLFV
jgi:hypothetical protein